MRPRFTTRKNFPAVVGVAAGFAILFASIGLPLLLDGFHWGLLFPLAIGGFMLFVLTASVMKFFISFRIDERGLRIFLPPLHRRWIPAGSIRSVRVLDAEEAKRLFETSIREMFSLGENADLAGFLRLLRRKSPAFRYLSVAPAAAMTTAGPKRHLLSLKVYSRQRMVLLGPQGGQELYLSPQDADAFVRGIAAILPR